MDTEFPSRVSVRYREHANTARYACDLAVRLAVPLIAHTPVSMEETAIYADRVGKSPGVIRIMTHTRMGAEIRNGDRHAPYDISTEIGPIFARRGDIEVSCDTSSTIIVPRISPAGETEVFRDDTRGPIFVPLGDGPSGLVGAAYGLQLAKRLDVPVIYWHTTWRNDTINASDPEQHICESARAVITDAKRIATAKEIPASCIIECAPTLVEGLVAAALRTNAALIVMAEGEHKRFGTYTERIRSRNCPVPLLIIPKGGAQ